MRGRIVAIYAVLLAGNLAAWAAAWFVFGGNPALFATAGLAYLFGLRHGFDADHIAAIDNVTRRLMHDGRRPVAVGLYFALGHSSVVVAASLAIAMLAERLGTGFAALGRWSDMIGASVSALFLFVIAAVNLIVLGEVWRVFRSADAAPAAADAALRQLLDRRGLVARLLRPAFRLIGASWHMFPLGMLFALGFDTASQVGLLGISATAATAGSSGWSTLVLSALFTAGMTLADTTDGVLMAGAYGWAFISPARKLRYNLTMTLLSVLVAGFIGAIEALGAIGRQSGFDGRLWRWIGAFGGDPAAMGLGILALFLASWSLSGFLYRLARLGERDRA
jgi:nickel/cobalt transporter (NiCoT) family protein